MFFSRDFWREEFTKDISDKKSVPTEKTLSTWGLRKDVRIDLLKCDDLEYYPLAKS